MQPDRRGEILRRLDEERRTLAADGLVIEVLPHVTRLAAVDGSWRAVIHSSLDAANADRIIEEEIAHCRSIRADKWEWKLFAHDRPADLMQRLERHGFVPGAREAVLVYDLNDPPAWARDDKSRRVARIDEPRRLDDFHAVVKAAFGERGHEFAIGELSRALAAGSIHHRGYVAYDGDGVPVSAGRLHTHPRGQFGGLYGGATIPTHRGRGFYRSTVAARARDALALGCRYLVVDAMPTSRPILERLGFVHVTDSWPCNWCVGEGGGPPQRS